MTRLPFLKRIDTRTKLKVYDYWIWACCGAIALGIALRVMGLSLVEAWP